jgi:hypothetical protein
MNNNHPYREPNVNPISPLKRKKGKCFFYHSWELICLTEEYLPSMTFEAFININKWGYKCKDCGHISSKDEEKKMGLGVLLKFYSDAVMFYKNLEIKR